MKPIKNKTCIQIEHKHTYYIASRQGSLGGLDKSDVGSVRSGKSGFELQSETGSVTSPKLGSDVCQINFFLLSRVFFWFVCFPICLNKVKQYIVCVCVCVCVCV